MNMNTEPQLLGTTSLTGHTTSCAREGVTKPLKVAVYYRYILQAAHPEQK